MKKKMILWMSALFLTIAGLSSCSSDDEIEGTELIGKWVLVEVKNGPVGQAWRDNMPKNYMIEITANETILFPNEEGGITDVKYTYSEHPNNIGGYDAPVIYIGEVPFGVTIASNRLELNYIGIATCDHIPATFIFNRKR